MAEPQPMAGGALPGLHAVAEDPRIARNAQQPVPAAVPQAAGQARGAAGFGGGGAAGAGAGAEGHAPVVRDHCNLRCLPIGTPNEAGPHVDDAALVLETRLSARVADVARQLQAQLGGGHGDSLVLVHGEHVLGGRGTLRDAGIEDGGVIHFYFAPAEFGEAAMDDGEAAALAQVAAAEQAAARAAEARAAAARLRAAAPTGTAEPGPGAGVAPSAGAVASASSAAAPSAGSTAPAVAMDEEDLYGPPMPASTGAPAGEAAGQEAAGAAGPSDAFPASALEDPETRRLLEELKAILLRPRPAPVLGPERSADRMTEAEIVNLLKRHVPNIDEKVGSDETPVVKLIVSTYRRGPQGCSDAAARERLASCLRRLLAMVRDCEKSGMLAAGHRGALCRRLVEAFAAGPSAQVRMIEVQAEGLSGGPALLQEAAALAADFRERALDRAVLQLHPGSGQQLPQLANLYRQALGFSALPAAETDAGTPPVRSKADALAAFGEACNAGGLAMALMADVNQPAVATERYVSLEGLRRWAEEPGGLGQQIYFDTSRAALYSCTPADEAQPFLHPQVAVKLLHSLLASEAAPQRMEE